MIFVRSLVFNVAFYVVIIVMLIVGMPVLLAPRQVVRDFARLWARLSLWLLQHICKVSVVIRGAEVLPEGGYILAAKHQSFLDIIALLSLTPRFVFVLKRELTFIPLFGFYLLGSGMIPIDRSKGRAVLGDMTRRVKAAVRSGHQLIIFPEGTRRPPGAEPAYKSGVGYLYAGAGVPCLPVALNAGLFWPRRSFLRRPGVLHIDVLDVIPPGLDRTSFLALLQDRIETASDAQLAEVLAQRQGRTA